MKGLKAIEKRLEGFVNREAKVGWFESARYNEDGQDISVAEVVVIQEYGAPGANIPPRPTIGPTIAEQGQKWSDNIAKGARAVIAGKATADQVLEIVGAQAAGDIRQTISEVRNPPLAESTLAQRARDGYTDQPLNRTGYMIATCTNVVGEASE